MRFLAREFTRAGVVCLVAGFFAVTLPNAVQAGFDYDENGNAFPTGQAVIAFKPGTTLITMKSVLARYGVDPSGLRFITPQTAVIRFDPRRDVLSFCQQMLASGWITASSPDHLCYCVGVPNDPYYSLQWGLKSGIIGSTATVGASFDGTSGYVNTAVGSGVRVGVIDSGVDLRHPEFGILPTGPLVTPAGGLYAAITLTNATPYAPVNNPPYGYTPGAPWDDFGHGTHVTGIIAARTGNRIGVASGAPSASILPIKIFDRSGGGGTFSMVAQAIQFASTNGCRVINMSLGGGAAPFVLTNAIQFAQTQTVGGIKGVVCVAAMGNDAARAFEWPAVLPGVVAVGALGPQGALAAFSTTGPHITLAAPGGDGGPSWGGVADNSGQIFSTYPSYSVGLGPPTIPKPTYTNYSYMSGTSMATPHVAAAAALLLQKKPYLSQAQVWAQLALFSTHTVPIAVTTNQVGATTPIPDTARDENMGYGLLNATSLLTAKQPALGSTTGIPHVFPYDPRSHFTYQAGSTAPVTNVVLTGMQSIDTVNRNATNIFSVIVVDDKGERIPSAQVMARFSLLGWGIYPASNISDTILYDDGAAAHGDLLNQDCVYANKVFIPNDYLGCGFQVQYIVTATGMRANTSTVVNVLVQ